jgi:hypothetical protein
MIEKSLRRPEMDKPKKAAAPKAKKSAAVPEF